MGVCLANRFQKVITSRGLVPYNTEAGKESLLVRRGGLGLETKPFRRPKEEGHTLKSLLGYSE